MMIFLISTIYGVLQELTVHRASSFTSSISSRLSEEYDLSADDEDVPPNPAKPFIARENLIISMPVTPPGAHDEDPSNR